MIVKMLRSDEILTEIELSRKQNDNLKNVLVLSNIC